MIILPNSKVLAGTISIASGRLYFSLYKGFLKKKKTLIVGDKKAAIAREHLLLIAKSTVQ